MRTDRLNVRRFREGDLDDLLVLLSDGEVNRFLPWYPVTTLEQVSERLARYMSGNHYAICLKEDDRMIGYVSVSENDSHDLGYGLSKAHWNRGITTEACRVVVAQLKVEGYPYLTATHDRDNPASGEVMKKLGMTYRYSYREQWQPKDISVVFRLYQLSFGGEDTYMGYFNQYPEHFVEAGV